MNSAAPKGDEEVSIADFFSAPLTVEGEAELLDLQFADALLALMKVQGVTRSELAHRMGVSLSSVTAMFSRSKSFTTEIKVRAARALGAKYLDGLAPVNAENRRPI